MILKWSFILVIRLLITQQKIALHAFIHSFIYLHSVNPYKVLDNL
jgi:hypothetical protein